MKISLKARGKINLSLEVVGKRADGYHNLSMVMQSIDIYDKISVELSSSNDIIVQGNYRDIPLMENLVYKGAKAFYNHTKIKGGCSITLHKNIPVAAGLAGGSSDAAGVIVALNHLYDCNLTNNELIDIGKSVGSDVPFCIFGGTMFVEGVGDKLAKLNDVCLELLIIKPKDSISTVEVFRRLDKTDYGDGMKTLELAKGIEANNREMILLNMENNMFEKSLEFAPAMKEIICDLKNQDGCDNAMMTGSGSTVFGIFSSKEKASEAFEKLQNKYDTIYQTTTYHQSITLEKE